MTYSVVMRDPETGAFGVAVQSHWFNVGRIVPWVRGGVGAVATQSLADPHYGPRALDLMAAGVSAEEALRSLLADDPEREVRQVAVIDRKGRVGAHTGSGCIGHAGHVVGDGWSVQANIMRSAEVIPAMADAAAGEGPIARRLLAVLMAAETAGGDLRGSQSTALLVVGAGPVLDVDLRVEDHPDPIGELRRLLDVHDLYDHMAAGDDALAKGDMAGAAHHYATAAVHPDARAEVRFWQAVGLATMGSHEDAVRLYRKACVEDPDLPTLLERLLAVELIDGDAAAVLRDPERS